MPVKPPLSEAKERQHRFDRERKAVAEQFRQTAELCSQLKTHLDRPLKVSGNTRAWNFRFSELFVGAGNAHEKANQMTIELANNWLE